LLHRKDTKAFSRAVTDDKAELLGRGWSPNLVWLCSREMQNAKSNFPLWKNNEILYLICSGHLMLPLCYNGNLDTSSVAVLLVPAHLLAIAWWTEATSKQFE
jgi:hypothetical protein